MLTKKQIDRAEERKGTYEPESAPCPGGATPESRNKDCDLVRRIKLRARFPRDGDDDPRGQGGSGTDEAW